MNSVTTDISSYIAANTSWVPKQGLFVGREPTSPNNVLTIFDTPGIGPLLFMNNEGRYDYANIQLRLRHTHYEQGMLGMWELVELLHGEGNIVIGGSLYTKIEALDSPALLNWDENNRARIIVNFEIQRRPQAVPET